MLAGQEENSLLPVGGSFACLHGCRFHGVEPDCGGVESGERVAHAGDSRDSLGLVRPGGAGDAGARTGFVRVDPAQIGALFHLFGHGGLFGQLHTAVDRQEAAQFLDFARLVLRICSHR